MILHVRHVTEYDYAKRVELAAHMLHLRPRSLPWQTVRSFSLAATAASSDGSAAPGRLSEAHDHHGNPVGWLFVDSAHTSLHLATEAVVEVRARAAPDPLATPSWEYVAAKAQESSAARDAAEFTFGSDMAPVIGPAEDWAAPSFPPGRPVLAGLLDLMRRLARDFRFQTGVTTVSTSVSRVLQLRAGVCQDFAHVMIAGLRSLRLPARYVSGYVRTRPPPGMARLRGADQSHAWVGCWLGPEHGWIDLDPTNDLVVGEEHVWLGWGRDYGDVSPVHGVLLGGGKHSLRVSVDIEAVAEAERAA